MKDLGLNPSLAFQVGNCASGPQVALPASHQLSDFFRPHSIELRLSQRLQHRVFDAGKQTPRRQPRPTDAPAARWRRVDVMRLQLGQHFARPLSTSAGTPARWATWMP